jgi:hypothetical protein
MDRLGLPHDRKQIAMIASVAIIGLALAVFTVLLLIRASQM